MTLEGEKLTALLKHDASIHIIDPETDIDYYGTLELSERSRLPGAPEEHSAYVLNIPVGKFVNTPETGHLFPCHLTGPGCVYHFTVAYRSASQLPDTIWYLDLPESAERIQLRDFVRVPIP